MLAQPHRRQDFPQLQDQPHASSFESPPLSQQLSFEQLSQHRSAQDILNQRLHNYLEQQQQTFANPAIFDSPNPFMTGVYDFANPAIRIQQSTPQPQLPSTFAHSSMQNATGSGLDWNNYANNEQNNSLSLQTPRSYKAHHRASSPSSLGSNGSQHQGSPAYSYASHSGNLPSSSAAEVDSSYSADEASRAFSNHLPTPSHTPTHDSFMSNTNNTYNTFAPATSGVVSTMAAHYSMKQALMDQNDDDVPGFAHSARHSVSSYGHDSPATPHTSHGEDFDDRFKMPPTGEPALRKVDSWLFDEFLAYDDDADMRQQHNMVPKFERSFTDAAVDNLYDPSAMLSQPQSMALNGLPALPVSNTSLLSPYQRNSNANTIVQRTLQAANNARSQSPSGPVSRGPSPFRHNSPFGQPSTGFNSPRVRVGTAAEAREQKIEADAAHAMKLNVSGEEALPTTISPKDALLDFREADEDSKMPLFPEGGASEYGTQFSSGDPYRTATQPNFDTTTSGQYRRDSWPTPQFSPNFPVATASSQPAPFSFAPPAISGNLHGLGYAAPSQYRSTPNNMATATDSTPDFPAHLTSMESSASEAEPQNSHEARRSQLSGEHLHKPASSAADSGTYTCTYHGCTLRFETPQKLQKHKREGHRSQNPVTVSTSMTSAALLERNSQAGPHKCERINPTTGKPCNTIFSRPYDLTRHEDTIHNVRKQKVRCALCVEDKTFSRNDALTRHMRVVHPEVDFPGKHKRRGGNHD